MTAALTDRKIMMISSDGHATARMEDYTQYLDPKFREEFGEFCKVYAERGSHTFEEPALRQRLDPYIVEEWLEHMVEPGRIDGNWNPERRLAGTRARGRGRRGVVPGLRVAVRAVLAHARGPVGLRRPHAGAGRRGRPGLQPWLADFCSTAPRPFRRDGLDQLPRPRRGDQGDPPGQGTRAQGHHDAHVRRDDAAVCRAVRPDLEHDRGSGARAEHPRRESRRPRAGGSARTRRRRTRPVLAPLFRGVVVFYCQQIVDHLVWGGVFERHPRLNVVFTEQGSAWFAGKMIEMDHSWGGSYLRRDVREIVKRPPSEYFDRQCHIGSSLLSAAEVGYRHVDRRGQDDGRRRLPAPRGHLERRHASTTCRPASGRTTCPRTRRAGCSGETAAEVFGFDVAALAPIVERVGPTPEQILTPPTEDLFPRGDVHKPLAGATIF